MHSQSESGSMSRMSGGSTSGSESVSTDADGELAGATEGASTSETWSTSASSGWSNAVSEALEPLLQLLPTQVYSLQEQIHRATALLVNQPPRKAIVKLSGKPSVQVTTPFVREAVARDERVERFKERCFGRQPFTLPRESAEEMIRTRRAQLRDAANRYTTPQEPESFLE